MVLAGAGRVVWVVDSSVVACMSGSLKADSDLVRVGNIVNKMTRTDYLGLTTTFLLCILTSQGLTWCEQAMLFIKLPGPTISAGTWSEYRDVNKSIPFSAKRSKGECCTR